MPFTVRLTTERAAPGHPPKTLLCLGIIQTDSYDESMKNYAKTILSLATAGLLLTAPAAAQEIHLPWSDTHNEVLAKHNAAIYTTPTTPMNWWDVRFNRVEAQLEMERAFPENRKVVQEIQTVDSTQKFAENEDEMFTDIRGLEFDRYERY